MQRILYAMVCLTIICCGCARITDSSEANKFAVNDEPPKSESNEILPSIESKPSLSGSASNSVNQHISDNNTSTLGTHFTVNISNLDEISTGNQISFSLVLPENYSVDENYMIFDDEGTEIAKVAGAYQYQSTDQPFLVFDELYRNADPAEELLINQSKSKYYWLQEEVSEGGVTGFVNTLVYIVNLNDAQIKIEFYPHRGVGGISSQQSAFESILATIG